MGLHITASALWMEKTLEIYKTIKYKEEIFFHPTVRVFLPDSRTTVIFQLIQTDLKNGIFFSKAYLKLRKPQCLSGGTKDSALFVIIL